MGCGRRERGSTRPAPERRDQPRGQWKLSRGECRLVHTHPLWSTVQPQAPRLELESPAVPILTRADAAGAPRPPCPVPAAGTRHPGTGGAAPGSVRAGVRGRAARSPASPGLSPRRPSAQNSAPLCPVAYLVPPPQTPQTQPPRLRAFPRHAAPRPGRSAGSTGLGATASPW